MAGLGLAAAGVCAQPATWRLVTDSEAGSAEGRVVQALATALNAQGARAQVEHLPGDQGLRAAAAVLAAPRDGKTWFITHGLGPAVAYQFVPLALMAHSGAVVYAHQRQATGPLTRLPVMLQSATQPTDPVATVLVQQFGFQGVTRYTAAGMAEAAAARGTAVLLAPPWPPAERPAGLVPVAASDAALAEHLGVPSFGVAGWGRAAATTWQAALLAPGVTQAVLQPAEAALRTALQREDLRGRMRELGWLPANGDARAAGIAMQQGAEFVKAVAEPRYLALQAQARNLVRGSTPAATSATPEAAAPAASLVSPVSPALPVVTALPVAAVAAAPSGAVPPTSAPAARPGAAPTPTAVAPAAAGPWPLLKADDLRACLPQIRHTRTVVGFELGRLWVAEACAEADANKVSEQCDDYDPKAGVCRRWVNRTPCENAKLWDERERRLSDLDWYYRGRHQCESIWGTCYGPPEILKADGGREPVTPEERDSVLEWQQELARAAPLDWRRLPKPPFKARKPEDVDAELIQAALAVSYQCTARVWISRYEAARQADDKAQAGFRGLGADQPDSPAALQPKGRLACESAVMEIHRDARDAIQVAKSPAESDLANAQMARRQRALFQGPCRVHEQAADYLRTAERILSDSKAFAAREAAADGAGSGAGAGDVPRPSGLNPGPAGGPRGVVIASSGEPAHQCLEPLKTGLYGGFYNRCNFKVNYTYCVAQPKEGAWTDANAFKCESDENTREDNGYISIGAQKSSANHTRGGKRVLWFGCKHPAVPHRHRYNGSLITGICLL